MCAESGDGLAGGVLEMAGEGGHGGDGFDVAGGDAAAVGAYDAAEERGVLVVLDDPRSPFWCQGLVDAGRALSRAGDDPGLGACAGRVRDG